MDPNMKLRQAVRRFAAREMPNPVGSIVAIYNRYAQELGDEIATLQIARSQLLEMAKHAVALASNHRGRSTPKKKRAKKAAKKAAALNGMTQRDVALKILKLAKHPLNSADVQARMKDAGVTTKSKNFPAVVGTLLRKMETDKVLRGRRRKGQPKFWTTR